MRMVSVVFVSCLAASSVSAQDEPAAPAISRRALHRALARYALREPPVDRVVAAALETTVDDPGRLRSLATRARLAGLVPTIRLGARRGREQDISALLGDTMRTNLSTDDELTLSATATFHLDRLVYVRDELSLARERRALGSARRRVARAVVRLYFERRRLLLERDLRGQRDPATVARIGELTALLNVFTAGRFGRMMGPSRSTAWSGDP